MNLLDTKIGTLTFKQRIKRDFILFFEPVIWVYQVFKLAFKRD